MSLRAKIQDVEGQNVEVLPASVAAFAFFRHSGPCGVTSSRSSEKWSLFV